jgi:8-oxo-dGTP pyrophosphatase MutT (NUDIX family)
MDQCYRVKKTHEHIQCINCGLKGHVYRMCKFPRMSFGIILIDISTICDNVSSSNILDIKKSFENRYMESIYGNYQEQQYNNTDDTLSQIQIFRYYCDKIKFLLVQRKFSIGFIEFIRGKYNINDPSEIIKLFEQMTSSEILLIQQQSYDDLWNMIWSEQSYQSSNGKKEYSKCKHKFNYFKSLPAGQNLDYYIHNHNPIWNSHEWGFPKGKRNIGENDLQCAIRELHEESNYTDDDYILLDIPPLKECITGTNGINYMYVYYVGLLNCNKPAYIDEYNNFQNTEIGSIAWLTFYDSFEIIRTHHFSKKNILAKIFFELLNIVKSKN